MPTRSLFLLLLLLSLTFASCESGAEFLGVSLLIFSIGGIVALILIIIAILDLIQSSRPLPEKLFWGVVIWVIPVIGALIYLLVGKS